MDQGWRIGRYELRERISEGPFSEVFEGEESGMGRPVLVQAARPELAENDTFRKRFLEAARSVRLDHPSLARLVEVVDDPPAVVTRRDEAASLAEWLQGRSAALSGREWLELALPVVEALEHAHGAGIVHGALDASLVRVGETFGGRPRPVVEGLVFSRAVRATYEGQVDPEPEQDVRAMGRLLLRMAGAEAVQDLAEPARDCVAQALGQGDSPPFESMTALRRALEDLRFTLGSQPVLAADEPSGIADAVGAAPPVEPAPPASPPPEPPGERDRIRFGDPPPSPPSDEEAPSDPFADTDWADTEEPAAHPPDPPRAAAGSASRPIPDPAFVRARNHANIALVVALGSFVFCCGIGHFLSLGLGLKAQQDAGACGAEEIRKRALLATVLSAVGVVGFLLYIVVMALGAMLG